MSKIFTFAVTDIYQDFASLNDDIMSAKLVEGTRAAGHKVGWLFHQESPLPFPCICIPVHTHTHVHTHVRMHAHTHTHTRTNKEINIGTWTLQKTWHHLNLKSRLKKCEGLASLYKSAISRENEIFARYEKIEMEQDHRLK